MQVYIISWARRLGVLIIAAGMLGLIAVSPIALRAITRIPGMDWMRLSNVGQTYGAVSALLTALALGGVVISLLYQAQAVRTAREQTIRTFHHELVKLEMEDRLYMEVLARPWDIDGHLTDYDSLRQCDYAHMWVSYWEGLYMQREWSDSTLRAIVAEELFTTSPGRKYWSSIRKSRITLSEGRHFRFSRILDEEYQKAIAGGPPRTFHLREHRKLSPTSQKISRTESMILIGVATVGGGLAGHVFARRLTQKR